uniref:PPM-type phosphatase domain-containing protein n=1 Tax=Chlamydomonas euryale TaxID=1486919 RepID=A0A7R9YQJ1_9CHLO|mmetsp:Transcript_11396/g.33824  ORF Transcript_11396/g.33824 Transcript_11396/m.33824 type:complete len:242 (+) Transcript_11396:183-908(+)
MFNAGIFDGHGGDQVSKELQRTLLQTISARICQLGDLPTAALVQEVIHTSYLDVNRELSRRMGGEAGSCAVTATLVATAGGQLQLFVANAGDCRAVLFTGPPGQRRAVRLSEDHKPHPQVCPAEIRRVSAMGGTVLWGRVQGCLAVSRAFGDKSLQPYVTAEPHISVRVVDREQDAFLYMASDGVTDVVQDAAGCSVVAESLARGVGVQQAAAALVNRAFAAGSGDNISATVMRFQAARGT